MKRSLATRPLFRPFAETLEDRCVLSVTVQIDYSFDTNGFFSDLSRRTLLQTAANTLGARLNDNLLAINPSGGNSWTATFDNPSTGAQLSLNNLSIPANTIMVFAGGRTLNVSEVGLGEFGGYSATGSAAWLDLVGARGQLGTLASTSTDFGPWGGAITFDTTSFNNPATGYFGLDVSKLKSGQNDFLSVAFHELEHLLGFGTAPSWQDQVNTVGVSKFFTGPNTNSFYDNVGLVPLSAEGGHFAPGLKDGGSETSMSPTILQGTRKLPTRLDYAGLQDLGWAITSDPDGTIAGAINSTLIGLGLQNLKGLFIGPDVSDVDLFKLKGSAGQILTATTSTRLGGTSVDTFLRVFDATGKELTHANSGIYDSLTQTLPASGMYYVGVSSASNVLYSASEDFARRLGGPVGDYNLTLRLDPASVGVNSDLTVEVATPAQAVQGKPFIYTISVTNLGPDPAGSVHVSETLPAGVTLVSSIVSQGVVSVVSGVINVDLGAIARNSGAVIQLTVLASSVGPILLPAVVTATQSDTNLSNNQDAKVTTIQAITPPPPPSDTTPPTITSVRLITIRVRHKKSTTMAITFSEGLDLTHANDPGAFILSKPGKAKRGKLTSQIPLAIKSALYFSSTQTIQLVTGLAGVLPKGLRILISGSQPRGIRDLAGNLLDGDRNGIFGGDAVWKLH